MSPSSPIRRTHSEGRLPQPDLDTRLASGVVGGSGSGSDNSVWAEKPPSPIGSRGGVESRVDTAEMGSWSGRTRVLVGSWVVLASGGAYLSRQLLQSSSASHPLSLGVLQLAILTIGTRLSPLLLNSRNRTMSSAQVNAQPIPWSRPLLALSVALAAAALSEKVAYASSDIISVQSTVILLPALILTLSIVTGIRGEEYRHSHLAILLASAVGYLLSWSAQVGRPPSSTLVVLVLSTLAESTIVISLHQLVSLQRRDPLSVLNKAAPVRCRSLSELSLGLAALITVISEGFPSMSDLQTSPALNVAVCGLVGAAAAPIAAYLIEALGSNGYAISALVHSSVLLVIAILSGSMLPLQQAIGLSIIGLGAIAAYLPGLLQTISQQQSAVPGDRSKTRSRNLPRIVALLGCLGLVWYTSRASLKTDNEAGLLSPLSDANRRAIKYPLESHLVDYNKQGNNLLYSQHGFGVELIPPFDPSIDVSQLPRLAWVVHVTADFINEYSGELAQLSCYCLRAGIPFYIESHLIDNKHDYMTARHRSIAKYLRYHQWVFATDADFMVGDSTRDLRDYLDDTVDVIVSERDNKDRFDIFEVCACAYFVRNSPGGWSFLQRWLAWNDQGVRMNRDNGDLIEMISAGILKGLPNNKDSTGRYRDEAEYEELGGSSAAAGKCTNGLSGWGPYLDDFLRCFKNRVVDPMHEQNERLPYWQADLWAWPNASPLPPVALRTYKLSSGFLRWITHPDGFWPVKHAWETVGIPGDFLYMGKGMKKWLTVDGVLCTGKEWLVPEERWDLNTTRKRFAEEGGPIWWPGCFDGDRNICKQIREKSATN